MVELVIYLTIAISIAGAFGYFAADVLLTKARTGAVLEVQENARFVMNRIVTEIEEARSVDTTSSTFGVNLALAANAGKRLVLTMASSTLDPTEFSVASSVLKIRQGAGATGTPITTDELRVQDLEFWYLADKNQRSLDILMTIESAERIYGGRLVTTTTLRGAATLRNR